MGFARRDIILALPPALLVGAAPPFRLKSDDARQRAIASVWPQMAALPYFRQPATVPAEGNALCYMFSNRSCPLCQGFHRIYPRGFRSIEMRFVVIAWPGDSPADLNYLYSSGPDAGVYQRYMAGKLDYPASTTAPDQVDRVAVVARNVSRALIEGGIFGTPYFLLRSLDAEARAVSYEAGDIAGMQETLDAAAN